MSRIQQVCCFFGNCLPAWITFKNDKNTSSIRVIRVIRVPAMVAILAAAGALTGCARAVRQGQIIYMAVASRLAPGDMTMEIKRSFLEEYKNKVTIKATFTVDDASGSPNPREFDGDLHVAGRAPEIGLRLVSEIMNAGDADSAVALIKAAEKSHLPVKLTGVWRLWPEHALGGREQQGERVEPMKNPNPDHAFEIHPIIRLDRFNLLAGFHPVDKYRPGSAPRTFKIYQEAACSLSVGPNSVTLVSQTGLYNDVHFLIEPTGEPQLVVDDGRFVMARALDTDGNQLVERLRLVLVKGSAPERMIRSLPKGARRHVWGLPRVSFVELSRRIRESATNPAVLVGTLPYEIIVLGVYPEEKL